MPTDTTMLDLCSIIEQAVGIRLSYIASSHGGEYAGPCPFCGGNDRFRVWPNADLPHWWCRGCNKFGDAIQFLRETQGLDYREACERLGIEPGEQYQSHRSTPALSDDAPPAKWQETANLLVNLAEKLLWRQQDVLDYLHKRGLTDDTIRRARFGYIPAWKTFQFDDWGLDPDQLTEAQRSKGGVKIPDGLLIPWFADGKLWKLTVKRPFAKPNELKYGQITGSRECLYNADAIKPDAPVCLSEAVFDALSAQQVAGELCASCATDGAANTRGTHWIALLSMASTQLIAFDDDENKAGDREAHYWLDIFPRTAFRWTPWAHDINDMLRAKQDIRAWIQSGLALATYSPPARPTPALPYSPPDPFLDWQEWLPLSCSVDGCQRDLDDYDEAGNPLCHAHYLAQKYPPCAHCGGNEWRRDPRDGLWLCACYWEPERRHKMPVPVRVTSVSFDW
jgi:hypothetical protein